MKVVFAVMVVAVVCDLKLEQQNEFSLNTEAETTTEVKQFCTLLQNKCLNEWRRS